jgi:membrane protein YdbS with pleckstrin-like domain
MQCPACGVEVVQQAVYCHKCGERLVPTEHGSPASPRAAAEQAPATADALLQTPLTPAAVADLPEKELWRGGYSSKAMLGSWMLVALVSLVFLAVGIVWVRQSVYWLILVLVMLAPWLYTLAVLLYRRMSVRYLLTTQRFIHESGIMRRVTDRIEVLDMDDITYEQGLLERLAGVGTIRIASSDRTHPELVLLGIENVKDVSERFDDARRAERRRRGLHIEQI